MINELNEINKNLNGIKKTMDLFVKRIDKDVQQTVCDQVSKIIDERKRRILHLLMLTDGTTKFHNIHDFEDHLLAQNVFMDKNFYYQAIGELVDDGILSYDVENGYAVAKKCDLYNLPKHDRDYDANVVLWTYKCE